MKKTVLVGFLLLMILLLGKIASVNKAVLAVSESENFFLPLFYVPQNIIYANGDAKNLLNILGFEDYKIRSGIYLGNINGLTDLRINGLADRADEVFIKTDLENAIGEGDLGVPSFEVTLPYVRQKPGSLFYWLALKKEEYDKWEARMEPEKLFEKYLFYASKRIAELVNFEIKNTGQLNNLLENYKQEMENAIGKTKEVDKLKAYLETHREKIEQTSLDKEIKNRMSKVFDELDGKIKTLEKPFDLRNLQYNFEILPRKGVYELFLSADNTKRNTENMEAARITLSGDKEETTAEKIREDGWISFGKKDLNEGSHKLVLHLPEPENLVGTSWQKLEELKDKEEGVEFSSQGFFSEAKNLVFQEISNWQPGELYYLSFDYQTEVGSLVVGVLEEKKDYEEGKETVKKEKIFEKKLRTLKNTDKFEAFLKVDQNSLGAKIYFYSLVGSNQEVKAEFRNLKIHRIVQPKIVFRMSAENADKARITPKITFVKINPTKYIVKIEGATQPYTLVFSESFHKGWKAYINELTDSRINGLTDYGEVVASYFDGDIKEGTHKNIFLDINTFETWSKKSLPEDRHFLVNGYANSWYITPEAGGGRENYEIIIEFWPQRLFYVGLGISLVTLLGCLGYLGYSFARKKGVIGNEEN